MQITNVTHLSLIRKLVFSLVSLLLLIGPKTSKCQTCSPYSDFQNMTVDQLKTLQVKLTYVGTQNEPIASVVLITSSETLELSKFVPCQHPGINYSNDTFVAVQTATVSTSELKAMIDDVTALPSVTAGGVATDPFVSFAMVNSMPSVRGFEAVINNSDASDLLGKFRLAFQSDRSTLRTLATMGCGLDILEPGVPTDVSGVVPVAFSGFRLNRSTKRFVGTATIKNNSTSAIGGPLSLVFGLTVNVSLFNFDGTTCGTSPVGRAFVNLPLAGNSLPSGGTVQVTLEFNNPDLQPIQPITKVLAGPGAR